MAEHLVSAHSMASGPRVSAPGTAASRQEEWAWKWTLWPSTADLVEGKVDCGVHLREPFPLVVTAHPATWQPVAGVSSSAGRHAGAE